MRPGNIRRGAPIGVKTPSVDTSVDAASTSACATVLRGSFGLAKMSACGTLFGRVTPAFVVGTMRTTVILQPQVYIRQFFGISLGLV